MWGTFRWPTLIITTLPPFSFCMNVKPTTFINYYSLLHNQSIKYQHTLTDTVENKIKSDYQKSLAWCLMAGQLEVRTTQLFIHAFQQTTVSNTSIWCLGSVHTKMNLLLLRQNCTTIFHLHSQFTTNIGIILQLQLVMTVLLINISHELCPSLPYAFSAIDSTSLYRISSRNIYLKQHS